MTARHIAVVNFTRMGDLIQSGPLMRSLKNSHPGSRLTLVVFKTFEGAAERLPMVDVVVPFDVDQWLRLLDARQGDMGRANRLLQDFLADPRLSNIDLLVNLAHTPQSASLCGLLNAKKSFGLIRDPNGHVSVHGEWFNYLFAVMRDRAFNPFNLVEIYTSINSARGHQRGLEFRVNDVDRSEASALLEGSGVSGDSPYVVLQPGASSPSRQWSVASFSALAVRLLEHGMRSVVVGSREETELGERITAMSKGAAASIAGRTSVGSLGAILEGAYKLVSNDTGTIHLAAAVGTPTIGIYLGPASAKDTAPYASGHLVIEADLACAPCGYHDDCDHGSCRHLVTVDDVIRLVVADIESARNLARNMAGLRVFETDVNDRGEFHLQPLNAPTTGCESDTLAIHRDFWTRLLSNDETPSQLISPSIAISDSLWSDLRCVLDHATEATSLLRTELESRSPRAQRIGEFLRDQLTWQNELRTVMERSSSLSLFARYLLVRIATARNTDVRDYLKDMEETVKIFQKGMELLGRESVPISRGEEAYAAAC
jgi:ADP-heptose:LPS heptosyltransferase